MGLSRSRDSAPAPVIQPEAAHSRVYASQTWLLMVVALLLMRLVDTPDMWWTLARGRQVFSGSLTPSSDLLTLDSGREADWLSGAPFYALWSLFGHHSIAALPLIAGGILVWRYVKSPTIDADDYVRILIIPLLIIPLRAGLTADPMLWDLAFLMCLGKALSQEEGQSTSSIAVFVTFLIWGNFGPRPLWGLLLVLAMFPTTKSSSKLFLAAILGGMINPRGSFAWWDSLAYFSPFLFLEPAQVYDPNWYGMFSQSQVELPSLVFLSAWAIWVATELGGSFSFQKIFVWVVPLNACLISISNLPLAAAWILTSKSHILSPHNKVSLRGNALLMRGMICTVSCLVLVETLGWSGTTSGRLAWGINSINDVRLLNVDQLSRRDTPYHGWTIDRRSAGMIAWQDELVDATDHPQRALLGGRWSNHAQVMTDLLTSHRAKYQLENGSWGGWVNQLAQWDVDLLFIPADFMEMHTALLETPWKPFDLDSPVVPYVNADDVTQAAIVVESLRQQGFVESGAWQPTLAMLDSQGWRFDPCAAIGFGPKPDSAIRQSQLFRSLDLPMASLRVLLPVRQATKTKELQTEFQACQTALAYQEWVTFGATSEIRRAIVMNSDRFVESEINSEFWQSQQHSGTEGFIQQTDLFLNLYEQGNLEDAIRQLTQDSPQSHYVRAMLWLELGDSQHAQEEFQIVANHATEQGLHYAAQFWIEQLSPYVSP